MLQAYYYVSRAVKKHKRALLAGSIAEIVVAACSIPLSLNGSEAFLNVHRSGIGLLRNAYYSQCKQEFNNETLSRAFQHPQTQQTLDRLFIQDDALTYSEIAGSIFLDEDETGPFLRFYTTRTINASFADELFHSSDMHSYFRNNRTLYLNITKLDPQIFDTLIENNETQELLEHYIKKSDDNAFIDATLMHGEHLYRQGEFVGAFHLHNDESRPTLADSNVEQFVISKTRPYSFYRTGNGTSVRVNN
ncbi:MAG: hypothetical protein HY363_03470 [Candidatus Aenigmarchaeota archaeon]|nr:hypothetical protein [Candidatus Aenigmarchaeota archaeon]